MGAGAPASPGGRLWRIVGMDMIVTEFFSWGWGRLWGARDDEMPIAKLRCLSRGKG